MKGINHLNRIVFQILQCIYGIRTWLPQAKGERTLPFLAHHFEDIYDNFKPVHNTATLNSQVKGIVQEFAAKLAQITIIHYRKSVSDCIKQINLQPNPLSFPQRGHQLSYPKRKN